MLESITGGYKSKAKVVGSTLVLSLPDAITPSLWQLDLEKEQGCVFELQTNESAKTFSLIHKDKSGKKKTVASYGSRAQAMRTLIVATKALEKGQNITFKPADSSTAPIVVQTKGGFPWGKILLLGLILYIGYSFFTMRVTVPRQQADYVAPQTQSSAETSQQTTPNILEKAGEPVSADQLLEQLGQ